MARLSPWPPKPTASSAPIVDSPLLTVTAVHMRAFTGSITLKRINLSQPSSRACKTRGFRCLASKGRGFGPEPVKKKVNNSKTQKESIPIASDTSKFVFGAKKRTQQAPELDTGVSKSGNAVLDRQFLEKVEAVRRSALEQKKSEKDLVYQAIDYDAPIEPEQSTIGLGTKVGVGIAVVVFGLVFALGDFIPNSSLQPNDEATVVEKKLTDKERATLTADLQGYEATLVNLPEDPNALEGTAVTLVELGEYKQASPILEKLTKIRPNDVEAYRLLGDVKYELKDFEGSASSYKRSLSASDGQNFEALRGLTNSLLSAKKPNEAVDVLLSFREHLNSGNPDASNVLKAKNGKLEQKIQEVDPIQVELLIGKAYSDWGHVSDAVAVYDQLISKYPDDFRGYLAKGIILKGNGKVGDAERMFIQAKFFAPENAKALVDRYSRQ